MKPFQIPSFMSISTIVIELREFKEKKKKNNNMDKMCFEKGSGILFHTQFCFDTFYAVKSSEVELSRN